MKNKKISISLLLLLLAVTGGVYAKTSHIVWNPNRLAPESIAPGESRVFSATFTNKGPDTIETEDMKVALSGDVASIATVRNITFPKKLKKSDAFTITIDVVVPSTVPIGVVQGSAILVREDDGDDNDKKKKEDKKHKKVFLSDTLPIEITVSSILLPPNPGEAGKQDLLGVDIGGSDGTPNGVRDDIDRYIGLTYPASEKTRMALTQYAQEEQKILADADDEQKSIENIRLGLKALDCLDYIFNEDINRSSDISSQLEAESLNTPERSRAYIRADGHFGGQGIKGTSIEEDKAFCHTNPDTLAN